MIPAIVAPPLTGAATARVRNSRSNARWPIASSFAAERHPASLTVSPIVMRAVMRAASAQRRPCRIEVRVRIDRQPDRLQGPTLLGRGLTATPHASEQKVQTATPHVRGHRRLTAMPHASVRSSHRATTL